MKHFDAAGVVLGLSIVLAGCGGRAASSQPSAIATPVTITAPPAATSTAEPSPSPTVQVAEQTPSPETVATPSASSLPALPLRLVIPKIQVNAAVEHVGEAADGTMEAPSKWEDVGWFDRGYRPGMAGSAVIAGHLDSTTDRAVFWDLGKLEPGDVVETLSQDGSKLQFQVTASAIYPFDQAPLAQIFGQSADHILNLITCNGSFDRASKNYNKRLVVTAKQVVAK